MPAPAGVPVAQVPPLKNVNVTLPVGLNPATTMVTVALSCMFVPSGTDDPFATTSSLALCSSVAVSVAALSTVNSSHELVEASKLLSPL